MENEKKNGGCSGRVLEGRAKEIVEGFSVSTR